MRKRLLSALLAMAMVLALLPVSVLAAVDGDAWTGGVYEWYYTQLNGKQRTMYDWLKDNLSSFDAAVNSMKSYEVKVPLPDDMRTFDGETQEEWKNNFYSAYFALKQDHPEWPWLEARYYNVYFTDPSGARDEKADKNGWWAGSELVLGSLALETTGQESPKILKCDWSGRGGDWQQQWRPL